MKFFHLGDLHFGKSLHEVSLIEKDQPFWVDRFLEKVDEVRPDAVVIAGDVYDTRDPKPEELALFDRLITGLSQRDVSVIVTPGNHDNAIRVSYAGTLLQHQKIYTAGQVTKELPHVTLGCGGQQVTFWMMPYIFPKIVADVLDDPTLRSYNDAAKALLDAQDLDESQCNVLVAHQNVLAHGKKPEHSESETIIGGIGEIDYTVFDRFDYVALGHIHNAQPVGRDTVRYAGCPMYYDFSEVNRTKDLTLVTVNSKSDIAVEAVKMPLLHKLIQVSGTVDELVAMAETIPQKDKVYIQTLVTEKVLPPRTRDRLAAAYGDTLVNIKPVRPEAVVVADGEQRLAPQHEAPIDVQFQQFFIDQMDTELDALQEKFLYAVLDQQQKASGSYITEAKNVPDAETEELIRFLMNETMEDAQ